MTLRPSPRCIVTAVLCCIAGCRSAVSSAELQKRADQAAPPRPTPLETDHRGPRVARGNGGPERFVSRLLPAFRSARAFETVAFADRYYRAPANEGFDAVLDHVAARLREGGFGAQEGFELEILETARSEPAWTPRSGSVTLRVAGQDDRVLHRFDSESESDRTLLPVNAPSADVAGAPVFELTDVRPGTILVTRAKLSPPLLLDVLERGAVAVLSSSLADYNRDPDGGERHLDAIQFTTLAHPCPLPAAQISTRSHDAIAAATRNGGAAELVVRARTEFADRPLRTLVASVVGKSRPTEAVVILAHVQEPGACDNASGVAAALESALDISSLIEAGDLERPARSLCFVWGDEMAQSRIWLEKSARTTVAAISVDMVGESRAKTGAMPLLERAPDPGALKPLPPDEHTAWGASPVDAQSLRPDGLALIARCAFADVATIVDDWATAEHPYEGGSDHAVFTSRGLPAVLFWHFPDFGYHTSLDRMGHVDVEEMRRTSAAFSATALSVADPRPTDLERYLKSWRLEQDARLFACAEAGDPKLAEAWRDWGRGSRLWLRALCLGLPFPERMVSPPAQAP